MKSPFTDREMVLVCNLSSRDRYYLCLDTNTLFLTNVLTKFDLQESNKLRIELLQRMKA